MAGIWVRVELPRRRSSIRSACSGGPGSAGIQMRCFGRRNVWPNMPPKIRRSRPFLPWSKRRFARRSQASVKNACDGLKDFLRCTPSAALAWFMPAPMTAGGLPCPMPAIPNCRVPMRLFALRSWSGHIHIPYIRRVQGMTVANTGSVSQSYDGDTRASYLLIEGASITIRRVEYDVKSEAKELLRSGLPHADWLSRILLAGKYSPPE